MRSKILLLAALAALFSGLAVTDALAPSAYYVRHLPGAPAEPIVKMHAGHIEITPEHNGNIFFWHFQNQHIADKQRTILWLNGGPGCSSEDGAMMEIGPYRVKPDGSLTYNNGSWNQFANLLFVDNPVGTGFSYVDTDSYISGLDVMADNMITFLEKWFELFPEYADDELYLAGESFAGQYIPYIAKAIIERNKKNAGKEWNLRNLMIGNGWISPVEQYRSIYDFVLAKKLVPDSDARNHLEKDWKRCESVLANDHRDHVDYGVCESVMSNFLKNTMKINDAGKNMCYNMYDVRLRDTFPSCGMNWPDDLSAVTKYLRRKDVTEALHINSGKTTGWTECSGAVGTAFRRHQDIPSVTLLPGILKHVPITLFSGAEDLICNWMGTEAIISNMTWNGAKGMETSPGNWAPRLDWHFNDATAGFWQEARNLTFVLFNEASHMVPLDWPERTLDMANRIMNVDPKFTVINKWNSHIHGEPQKGATTPGNSTLSDGSTGSTDPEHEKQVEDAKWQAYRKSGEIVLAVVISAVLAGGYFVWRDRQKNRGYQGLEGGAIRMGTRPGGRRSRDVEAAAAEFDERLLQTPTDVNLDRYSVGQVDSDSDDDKSVVGTKAPGRR